MNKSQESLQRFGRWSIEDHSAYALVEFRDFPLQGLRFSRPTCSVRLVEVEGRVQFFIVDRKLLEESGRLRAIPSDWILWNQVFFEAPQGLITADTRNQRYEMLLWHIYGVLGELRPNSGNDSGKERERER